MEFSAVRTTGIYCRPGCGARPRADNVRTFEMAAAAEAAGYRACLRCRPYRTHAGVPADAPALVCRAVQLVIAGALDVGGEADLAARLSTSPRHLRRLFDQNLGITPDQFARSRRAHFARRLLDDTDLPIIEVAFAAGFGSLRQFNRTMREVFRELTLRPSVETTPGRQVADRWWGLAADTGDSTHDWPGVLRLLGQRTVPGVESVHGGVYRRTVSLDGAPGVLELAAGDAEHLVLRAHLPFWEGLIHVADRAAVMVGAGKTVAGGESHMAADEQLDGLVRRRPGLRLPGSWSVFEAVCAVLAASEPGGSPTRLGHMVRSRGVAVPGLGHGLTHLFPSAESLVDVDGQPAVRAFARAVVDGLDLDAWVDPGDITGVPEDARQAVAWRLGMLETSPSEEVKWPCPPG